MTGRRGRNPLPAVINAYRFSAPITALAPPNLWFETACVYNITGNYPLYELAADTVKPIYSQTKLLGALVLLDYKSGSGLNDTVTVSAADAAAPPVVIGLLAGDIVSYGDLLEAMITAEAADATYCLARNIGDLIYANAGNTGTQGMTRFVEALNAKAAALGLTSFTIDNVAGNTLTGNTGSARDLAKLAQLAEANVTIQPLTVATSGSITVAGPNARTINFNDPLPYDGRASVSLHMVGFFNSPIGKSSYSMVWTAPNGHKIAFAGLFNEAFTVYDLIDLDIMRQQLTQDFTFLDPLGTLIPTDASLSSVKLLLGADTAITDESPSAQPLTVTNATRVSSPRLLGTHSISFNGTSAIITAPGGADWQFGSGNFTIDVFFRWDNNGVKPTIDATFLSLWSEPDNQRSWLLNFRGSSGLNVLQFLWSTNGTTVGGNVQLNPSPAVFERGTNHLAVVRSGGTIAIILNGTSATAAAPNLFASTTLLRIGAVPLGGTLQQWFPGHLDEVRITKGVARYSTAGWAVGSASGQTRKFPRA